MRLHHKQALFALLLMLFCIAGCSTIDCGINNSVYCKYKLAGDVTTLNDTLTITADLHDGNDSVIINKAQKTDSFTLPMSYQQDEDVFYYEVANPSNRYRDTVKIRKTNIPHFESVDCNPMVFHHITHVSYTKHAIDSIIINNPNVTNNVTTSTFLIYFKNHSH